MEILTMSDKDMNSFDRANSTNEATSDAVASSEESNGLPGEELTAEERELLSSSSSSSDKSDRDELVASEERKRKQKKALAFGIPTLAALVIAATIGGSVVFNDGNSSDGANSSDNGGRTSAITNEAPKNEDGSVDTSDDFWKEKGKETPVKTKEWTKSEYSEEAFTKDKGIILTTAMDSSTPGGTDATLLPSESAGFTSDVSKEYLNDGTINPDFSYWTAEVYQAEVTSHVERLLNPTYGGWSKFQYPAYPGNSSFELNTVSDMFTTRYLNENSENPFSDYIPVYADWNGDNYGGENQLLESGPRWYGTLDTVSSDFTYDDATQQYTVKYAADVTFTAWTTDESKLEKKGKLELTFVANVNGANASSNRVLIDNAKLTVG